MRLLSLFLSGYGFDEYTAKDEEVKAVQIISAAMKHTPHSYTLLHAQSEFLRSKGKVAWALKLAKEAVNCAPSEFVTWEKLTELYIDTKDYESVRRCRFPLTLWRADGHVQGIAHAQFVSHVYVQWQGCA